MRVTLLLLAAALVVGLVPGAAQAQLCDPTQALHDPIGAYRCQAGCVEDGVRALLEGEVAIACPL